MTCNQCINTGWRGITEKDVYGQEPVEDGDPTFADSMAKYHPDLCYLEFNPKDFEKHWLKEKPIINMKPILQIIRCAAVVIVGISILTIAAKIVVTGVKLIWGLW